MTEDKDYAKDKEYAYHNLSLIVSFVRHAEEDLLGVKKKRTRSDGSVCIFEFKHPFSYANLLRKKLKTT